MQRVQIVQTPNQPARHSKSRHILDNLIPPAATNHTPPPFCLVLSLPGDHILQFLVNFLTCSPSFYFPFHPSKIVQCGFEALPPAHDAHDAAAAHDAAQASDSGVREALADNLGVGVQSTLSATLDLHYFPYP